MAPSKEDIKSKLLVGFFAFVCGALITILIQKKSESEAQSKHLFVLFDQKYELDNLPPQLSAQLSDHLTSSQQQTQNLLKAAVLNALQDMDTAKLNQKPNIDEWLLPPTVTEEEVNHFWQNNQERIHHPFHKAEPEIRKHLEQQKWRHNLNQAIQSLVNAGELEFNQDIYPPYPKPQQPNSLAQNGTM